MADSRTAAHWFVIVTEKRKRVYIDIEHQCCDHELLN